MKTRVFLTKKDAFVVLGCIAFLWTNLAVISTTGRHRAKDFVCRSNLQQWASVFAMYANDNDGGFTPGWYTGPTTGTVKPGERWFDAMKPYFDDNNDLVCCPTAVVPRRNTDGTSSASAKFSAWGKFEGGGTYPVSLPGSYGSYGINIYICNPPVGSATGRDSTWFYKGPNVANANQIPVLFDSMWIDAYPLTSNEPPWCDGDFSENGHIDGMKNCCIDRHSAAINMFFLDFSVRRIGLKQLWELPWHTEWWATYQTPTQWNDPQHWMYNMKDFAGTN